MIIVPIRRAVDPIALAQDSGILRKTAYRYTRTPGTLRGGLAFNIPGVTLPGGGSGAGPLTIGSSLDTIAQFDPEPVSSAALHILAKISSFIGIGKGRMEADKIVPYQNQIEDDILAPVNQEILKGTALSCGTLAALYQQCMQAWLQWIDYLHNTQWADGRAARQAEATLAPYWRDLIGDPSSGAKGKLEQIWDQKGCGQWDATFHPADAGGGYAGSGGAFVGPIRPSGGIFDFMGGGNAPAAIGLGLLAFYLYSKRRG